MKYEIELILFGIAFTAAILGSLEFGRRLALRWSRKARDKTATSSGIIDTSVFGLMGLLVAFAFNGAAGRYDTRRVALATEANAVGTAWLRLDLLPEAPRAALKAKFREYMDVRLKLLRVEDLGDFDENIRRFRATRSSLWSILVAETARLPRSEGSILLLPAVNEMFDLADMHVASLSMHIPSLILFLLCVIAMISSTLAGFAMATAPGRSWFHQIVFAVILSLTIMVTLDLEYPRVGFIRLDRADQPLISARAQMD